MFELTGKYGAAKIYTDLCDNESISQVINMLNQPFVEGQTIRMMPDIHAGAGCTIGTTMTLSDKVCPNLVGVDIGCGMLAVKLDAAEIDFARLDEVIRTEVPSGFDVHATIPDAANNIRLENLACASKCDLDRAYHSLGTLGGGNHFIEVDIDNDSNLWLVIHTGSRHLGTDVATLYQKEAIRLLHSVPKTEIQAVIQDLKAQGREREIQTTIQTLKPKYLHVPDSLCWCEDQLFHEYIHDMKLTQEFADLNRKTIKQTLLQHMHLAELTSFTTIHNYIDTDAMILRKGAVSAKQDELLLIPMNMRDGSLVCRGKGNPDWNYSAPHGAGRLMSRSAAKEHISMAEFTKSMSNVWSTSVQESTIDESPMAYKPMESIIKNIQDTVEIIDIIKPVYNFKNSAE